MKARNSIKSGGGVRSLLTSGKIGPFTGCFAKIMQSAVITFGVCYKYSFNSLALRGCLSCRRAFPSIWRMRSRVNPNFCPTSSSVYSLPSFKPKRRRSTWASRGDRSPSASAIFYLSWRKRFVMWTGTRMARASAPSQGVQRGVGKIFEGIVGRQVTSQSSLLEQGFERGGVTLGAGGHGGSSVQFLSRFLRMEKGESFVSARWPQSFSFRFWPHSAHRPLQSGLQTGLMGTSVRA